MVGEGWGFPHPSLFYYLFIVKLQNSQRGIFMGKFKGRKGFTLAELLIVVAIVGILVAISVPIFTAQTKKAVIATNKANIRSARSAAVTEFYTNPDITDIHDAFTVAAYFVYDIKEGKIEKTIIVKTDADYGRNNMYQDDKLQKELEKAGHTFGSKNANDWGRALAEYAESNHVCPKIFVFIGGPKNIGSEGLGATVQTAPYYTDDNQVGWHGNGNTANPFGPEPGGNHAG